MKKLKNTAAALTAAVTSAMISAAANAEGGLAASKAVTPRGTQSISIPRSLSARNSAPSFQTWLSAHISRSSRSFRTALPSATANRPNRTKITQTKCFDNRRKHNEEHQKQAHF